VNRLGCEGQRRGEKSKEISNGILDSNFLVLEQGYSSKTMEKGKEYVIKENEGGSH